MTKRKKRMSGVEWITCKCSYIKMAFHVDVKMLLLLFLSLFRLLSTLFIMRRERGQKRDRRRMLVNLNYDTRPDQTRLKPRRFYAALLLLLRSTKFLFVWPGPAQTLCFLFPFCCLTCQGKTQGRNVARSVAVALRWSTTRPDQTKTRPYRSLSLHKKLKTEGRNYGEEWKWTHERHRTQTRQLIISERNLVKTSKPIQPSQYVAFGSVNSKIKWAFEEQTWELKRDS